MDNVRYGHGTHAGRVRGHNEDNHIADNHLGLWVVADGMGGHECGEVASRIVVDQVRAQVEQGADISAAVEQAHRAVLDAAEQGQGRPGMGSTVVAIKLTGDEFEVVWVGDSRAYLWEARRSYLRPLTRDHSLVQQMIDAGRLSRNDAAAHPYRSFVTQALGAVDVDRVKVDRVTGTLQPGHQILLCSDGLTGEVPEAEIRQVMGESIGVQAKVDRLIQRALEHGGSDNVTVVLVSAPDPVSAPAGKAAN